jgi:predicted transcriptional regulator
MSAKPRPKTAAPSADPADIAEIEAARAEVDAGKTVSYERVRRWLLSWGTKKELPRPRCK